MRKKVTIKNMTVFYQQFGQGKPLLLLHGWQKSAKDYRVLGGHLAKKFLVVIPDLPGFGQTCLPDGIWGVPDYALWVESFVAQLGWKEYYLLGHSFGGRIALQLGANQPPGLKKLILSGVPILRKSFIKRALFFLGAKTLRVLLLVPPFIFFKKTLQKAGFFLAGDKDYSQTSGQHRKIFKRIISYTLPDKITARFPPTLLLWGEKDSFVPLKNGQSLAKRIPRARLVSIPGTHKLPYEDPKQFSKEVFKFLK
ncbi:alpha/beta fold hydrolase [Patescibacteria group bacterium]